MPDSAAVSARCESCGRGLPFEEWQRGITACRVCTTHAHNPRRPVSPQDDERIPLTSDYRAYNQMVDEVPDELLDELLAALESEAEARRHAPLTGQGEPSGTLLKDVLDEMGVGKSASELPWTLWGFAAGFALNVALAKYAQMSTGGAMSEFLAPMFIGGIIAGVTCGAIGWGLARLREH